MVWRILPREPAGERVFRHQEGRGVEIRFGNYLSASFLLEREPQQWHALVVLDSGMHPTDFVEAHARSFLYLRFDDVEEARPGKQAPTQALIKQALAFARAKDRLLVSCRAGQGRSVALAYLIFCREHGLPDALKLLDATRHRPNRLVVSIGDALLEGLGVLAPFDEWRRRHSHIRLSDYYDDMEKEFEALEAQGARNRICEP
jgi:predicted protein tyrosine phosphatase